MPELPEVETIRNGLEKYVAGHEIEDIEILHPKPFQGDKNFVIGSKIKNVRRIGKGLILDLENNYSLAIHVKMTGQLVFRDKKTAKEAISPKVKSIPNKYTHVIFDLDKAAKLYFNDMRRFGWIKVLKTEDVAKLPLFKVMGPEPFKDLTLEKFKEILAKSSLKIKPLMMDQSKIGGIGNIYANDALWEARINPERIAKSMNEKQEKALFDAIIKVIKTSLKEGGSSENSYVNVLGQEGNYQRVCLVYGKKGEKCQRDDGGIIQRINLGGRGTFFCPVCQK